MSRESLIIFFGLLIIFLPSLGIPSEWKTYTLIASGVLLMLLGYSLRHGRYLRSIDKGNGERGTDSFVESKGSQPVITQE